MSALKIIGWIVILALVAVLLTQIAFDANGPNPNVKGDIGGVAGTVVGIVAAYFLFISSYSPLKKLPSFKIVRA